METLDELRKEKRRKNYREWCDKNRDHRRAYMLAYNHSPQAKEYQRKYDLVRQQDPKRKEWTRAYSQKSEVKSIKRDRQRAYSAKRRSAYEALKQLGIEI